MPQEVIVKQSDLFPDVITVVKDENGVVVDLTGASVKFSMRKARDPTSIKIDAVNGVLVSGTLGKISYVWAAGNTDTPGTYEGEFRVTPAAGDAFRVPTTGYIEVRVEQKVGT